MTNYSDKITPLITLLGDDLAEKMDYLLATTKQFIAFPLLYPSWGPLSTFP